MCTYFKKLDYFLTECIYSPNAYRGYARTFLKDLESIRPSATIHSGDSLEVKSGVKLPVRGTYSHCGYISSQELCKACILLEGLNRGLPKLGINWKGDSWQHIRKTWSSMWNVSIQSLTVSVTAVGWIGHAIRRSTRVTMSSVALENKVVIKQLAFSTMIVCIPPSYLKCKLTPNNAASLSI